MQMSSLAFQLFYIDAPGKVQNGDDRSDNPTAARENPPADYLQMDLVNFQRARVNF